MPSDFAQAVASIRSVPSRNEIVVEEAPAPVKLAPYAIALEAEVGLEEDLGHGRIVFLHDPDGQEGWLGTYRAVVFVKATLEPEMAADEMLASVAWGWLEEFLAIHEAHAIGLSGTVTRVTSESFGTIEDRPVEGQIEFRASWTPTTNDLGAHVRVWIDLMAQAAGMPPEDEQVTYLKPRR